jgi:hypothetical protein
MRRGSKPARGRRLAAIGAAAAAGVAGILARRTRRLARPAARERARWRCECGQDYAVSGRDRHRVYWIAGAEEDDPVLSGRCPRCDRPLPAQ